MNPPIPATAIRSKKKRAVLLLITNVFHLVSSKDPVLISQARYETKISMVDINKAQSLAARVIEFLIDLDPILQSPQNRF